MDEAVKLRFDGSVAFQLSNSDERVTYCESVCQGGFSVSRCLTYLTC